MMTSEMTPARGLGRGALLALFLSLAACNGDSSPPAGSTSPGTPSSTSVTVSPALGVVRDADVRLLALDGGELATGQMDHSGSLTLEGGSALAAGFVVEVSGNASATYYDEGVNAWRALPAGSTLHAASADGRGAVAVTALTEIAYQRALQLAGSSTLTVSAVTQANNELAQWLARVPVSIAANGSQVLPVALPDILEPAQPVDGAVQLNSSTAAGRYAILLASLAQQAFTGAVENSNPCVVNVDCSPLLPVIADLATDYADGVLDNLNPHGGSKGLPFIDPGVNPADVFIPAREDLTPQEEVGREFAGSYSLTCQGDSKPTTMVIQDNGAMTLSGPLGNFDLPFDDVTRKAPLVQHTYRITPTGKAFTARLSHMELGSVYYDVVNDLEINAHVNGSVQLIKGDTTSTCTTTFTRGNPQPTIPYFTDIVVGTHFYCLGNSPEGVIQVTLDWTPTTWSLNNVVQPQQYGAITQYQHMMFKQAYPLPGSTEISTYEQYQWDPEATTNFVVMSRAQLRYQGYPQFTVFDMGAGPYIQGVGGCYPEPQEWYPLVTGEGAIMLNFGETTLTL